MFGRPGFLQTLDTAPTVIIFRGTEMSPSTKSPLRIVQVGLGAWGRDWARLVIPTVKEVELVGCVDSDPKALTTLQELTPITAHQCFATLDEALESTRPGAVLVTTTLEGHGPITRAALEAGLHVLVEKPFTETLGHARELVDLAAVRGLTLMVSQNYRFFPAARTAVRLVEEAALGRLRMIWIDFRRNDPVPPRKPRRHHHEAQPLLVDMSIHHFDLLRLVLRREPESVYCEAWNPEWSGFQGPPVAVASVVFPGGPVAGYRGSWISSGPETAWAGEWRMFFDEGEVFWTSRGEDNVLQESVTVKGPRGKPAAVRMPPMPRIDRAGTLDEFAKAIRDGREPETSGRDNLGTIAFMTAAVESARLHERVEVPRTQPEPV
jgi:predicted dehydrogenase